MIEAEAGMLLPEPQHGLEIVGRKSDIDDVLRELDFAHRQSADGYRAERNAEQDVYLAQLLASLCRRSARYRVDP